MKANHLIFVQIIFLLAITIISVHAQSGWRLLNAGTQANLNAVHLVDRHTIFVAGDGGTVLWSCDSGLTWQDISPGTLPMDFHDVYFFTSTTGLVVGNGGTILRTTDRGSNWMVIPVGVTDDLQTITFWDSVGICGGLSQTILYSSNAGNSWNIAQSGYIGGGFWGSSILSPDLFYVVGENSIFQPLLGKTVDGGLLWSFIPFYLNNNEGRAYDLHFTDAFTGYSACRVWDGRGAIAKTMDGGNNWTSTFFNSPLYGIHFPISNASLIGYAVGEAGQILKTIDGGINWHTQPGGISETLNDVIFFDLNTGYVVGDHGVILKTDTGGEPPVGLRKSEQTFWQEFHLYPVYPNPFNSHITIEFYLPTANIVRVKIYNTLGELLAVLLDNYYKEGHHRISWNTLSLSSGTYFCQLESGHEKRITRFILLK